MILVTGGTGSFGKRYVRHLVSNGYDVRVFSRDEFKQHEMRKEIPVVDYVIGDVRDRDATGEAMDGVSTVVHAAALKHVATGERHPWEAIKTNIIGTQNVIDAAKDAGVEKLVFLSTDKACAPVNTYGATKMVAERLVLQAGYNAVRYGNVIGSRGSVLQVFNEQQHNGEFSITDRRMTRFAVTFAYAIHLVDLALVAPAGTIVIGKPPAMRIADLAYSFNPDAKITEHGPGPGEKLHEALLTEYEAARADDCGDYWLLRQDSGGPLPEQLDAFTSEDVTMTVSDIKEMIKASL